MKQAQKNTNLSLQKNDFNRYCLILSDEMTYPMKILKSYSIYQGKTWKC